MTADRWHLDPELIDQYAAASLGPSGRASVERHLQACAACRALVARSGAVAHLQPRLDTVWIETIDHIDAPAPTWLHRLVAGLGVPDHLARLIGLSTTFRAAWVASIVVVALGGIAIARGDGGPVPFLLLSPLVPVVGVAAAYSGGTRDPAGRAFEVATPFGELRLVLVRTTAVTAASMAILALVSLLVPGIGLEAMAWVLPALGLTATTLALSTRLTPERAAGLVAFGWAVALQLATLSMARAERPDADDLGALALPLQLFGAVLLAVSSAAFLARRHLVDFPNR